MDKIRCPFCKREYLPGEIFVPNYMIGQPKTIDRDEDGNIIWNDGVDQHLEESYMCDKCGRKFKIKAKIDYEIEKTDEFDLSEDYITTKYENRIFLKED